MSTIHITFTVLFGLLALLIAFLHTQYSALPQFVDRFPPNLVELKQAAETKDPSHPKEYARFTSSQNPNVTLFEVFQRSSATGASKDATVVIVHGWGEHSGRYDEFANFLSDQGYNVYRYDIRGHGYSSGQTAFYTMEEVWADLEQVLSERVVLHVKPLLSSPTSPHKVFLFGHSLGSFVTTSYEMFNKGFDKFFEQTVASPFRFGGLITSNAGLELGEDVTSAKTYPFAKFLLPIISKLFPSLPVQPALDPKFITRNEKSVKEYVSDPRIYKGPFIAAMSNTIVHYYSRIANEHLYHRVTVPLLVLVGTGDKSVNPQGSMNLFERAASIDKTLRKYENYYHELIQEPERRQVMHDMVEWLNDHC